MKSLFLVLLAAPFLRAAESSLPSTANRTPSGSSKDLAESLARRESVRKSRTPPPEPPKLLGPIVTHSEGGGRAIEFGWASRAGTRYQVERSGSLGERWDAIGGEQAGNGNIISYREPIEDSKMFYRVTELDPYAPIRRIATFGDSITSSGSMMFSADGTYYWPGCWPAHLRTVLGHRIAYEQNPLTSRYTFAVSGAKTSIFLPGGSTRAYWEALLTSQADTVMMMLGANDVADLTLNMSATASNIIGFWDEALAVGKEVIGMEVVSCRSDHPSTPSFTQRQDWLNAQLKQAAISRQIEFIECADVLDQDDDGFSDPEYLQDMIHPNIAGGMRLADHIAEWIRERAADNPTPSFPGPGDAAWVTPDAYPSGTGPKANGWTLQTAGNAVIQSRLVERTDGVPGVWQEIDVSGMTEAGMKKFQPTDFIQLYTANYATNCQPGEKLAMIAEIEMDDPFLTIWSEMHVGSARTADHFHGGYLPWTGTTPPAFKGFLITEPWSYTGGTISLAMVKACGNGRLRIGRLGIFRIAP